MQCSVCVTFSKIHPMPVHVLLLIAARHTNLSLLHYMNNLTIIKELCITRIRWTSLKVNVKAVINCSGKKWPMSDFVWMCQLDDTKELNLGTTYRNSTQASTFLSCISQEAFQRLSDEVQNVKFVNVSDDDSTHISCEGQSLWYTRIVNAGKVTVSYLGGSTLEKAKADGIVGGLASIIRSNRNMSFDYFAGKLTGITADSASVMLDRKSGVAARLQQLQSHKINIRCIVHRHALAYSSVRTPSLKNQWLC